jgi:NADH pyrophosphatase NudC (nudix superfamily)
MRLEDLDARWHELAEDVISGMKEWRQQHPQATFREIEMAVDERLARLRARMMEDAALVSRATEWETNGAAQPVCPKCGTPLTPRGKEARELTTQSDQRIHLERGYGVCPKCQTGLFPPG